MSYDQDEGFDFDDGFRLNDYEEDTDEMLTDEPLDDYEEEDPDSRYT